MESLLERLISRFQGVDSTFSVLVGICVVLFLFGEVLWLANSSKTRGPGLPREDARLKFIWSIFPALVLLILLFIHAPRIKRTAEVVAPLPVPSVKGGA